MARHILIVDDSAAMRHLLSHVSQRLGDVEVAEACDGLDALKRLATARYDLMFVDVNMPVLDGLKLIRRVRADRDHHDIKICVCTTEADTEEQARQLGADYFLRKPVSLRDIEKVLAHAFSWEAPQVGGAAEGKQRSDG